MSMACPQCGTWTYVKETRTDKGTNTVTRRYECANLHRFKTQEKVSCTVVASAIVKTSIAPVALAGLWKPVSA